MGIYVLSSTVIKPIICFWVTFDLKIALRLIQSVHSFAISNPKRQSVNLQSDLRGLLPPIHAQHGVVVTIKEAVLEMKLSVDKRDVR